MIIDFHTHVFPDELAQRALSVLSANVQNLYTPVSDATVAGLLRNMDAWNIDTSVALPVITRESQTRKTNEWAKSICSDRIVCFGGVYPHSSTYKAEIDYACELGLKGLKFHPEYQNFVVDDESMMKIYDYALTKGLILIFHAGFDPGFSAPFKSNPQKLAKVLRSMQGGTIVLAHLGGHAQWDEVEKYLVGKNVYLDTSMGFDYYPHEQFLRIAKNHGADKILFASDSPWSNAKTELECMQKLGLSETEMNNIMGNNAKRLLGII